MNVKLWAGAIAIAAVCSWNPDPANSRTMHAIRCTEDMRCWSWATMGNLSRGIYIGGYDSPTDKPRKIVVSPCKFAYLDFTGQINWRATKRLKGDMFARRHGCDPHKYAPVPS